MGFLSMEPSKKSSKYIIFSARHVSHCQDESRLNAKSLVNCACVVELYSQSNTLTICVKHTKKYGFIIGCSVSLSAMMWAWKKGACYASYMLIIAMCMALRAA